MQGEDPHALSAVHVQSATQTPGGGCGESIEGAAALSNWWFQGSGLRRTRTTEWHRLVSWPQVPTFGGGWGFVQLLVDDSEACQVFWGLGLVTWAGGGGAGFSPSSSYSQLVQFQLPGFHNPLPGMTAPTVIECGSRKDAECG